MNQNHTDYDHLRQIPIEELELSGNTIRVLKKRGVYTVADCIDFFNRQKGTMVVMIAPFGSVMNGEVAQQLKTHNFWRYVKSVE